MIGSKTTRCQLTPANTLHIKNRDGVIEVLHMKGFVQLHPIQRHERLIHLRSAHMEAGAEITTRHTGQSIDGPKEILA